MRLGDYSAASLQKPIQDNAVHLVKPGRRESDETPNDKRRKSHAGLKIGLKHPGLRLDVGMPNSKAAMRTTASVKMTENIRIQQNNDKLNPEEAAFFPQTIPQRLSSPAHVINQIHQPHSNVDKWARSYGQATSAVSAKHGSPAKKNSVTT